MSSYIQGYRPSSRSSPLSPALVQFATSPRRTHLRPCCGLTREANPLHNAPAAVSSGSILLAGSYQLSFGFVSPAWTCLDMSYHSNGRYFESSLAQPSWNCTVIKSRTSDICMQNKFRKEMHGWELEVLLPTKVGFFIVFLRTTPITNLSRWGAEGGCSDMLICHNITQKNKVTMDRNIFWDPFLWGSIVKCLMDVLTLLSVPM